MVFRILIRILANNEHLIQRLSESYPVRRAAQWVVLFFHRGKDLIDEKSLHKNITPQQFRSFMQRFLQNLRGELKQSQDKFKKHN